MKTYKLIIHKAKKYPYYEKEEEKFKTFEEATQRMNEVSKSLIAECRQGKLQDYQVSIK